MNTETQKLIGKAISYIRSSYADDLTIAYLEGYVVDGVLVAVFFYKVFNF